MKTFLTWVLLAPVILLGLVFCVVNRQIVTVTFDPFNSDIPGLAFSMPLFMALVLAGMFGVVIGGSLTWLAQGRYRKAARMAKAELANLRMQGDRLRLVPPPTALPAPVKKADLAA